MTNLGKSTTYFVYTVLLSLSLISTSLANQISSLSFTNEEKEWIKNHPEVSMTFTVDFPPTVIKKPDGTYDGVLPDYARMFSEKTGIHFKVNTKPSWREALKAGRNRDSDIVGPVTAQPIFTEHYHFSLPIGATKTHVFGPLNAHIPGHSIEGLQGKKVGYIKSVQYVANFTQLHPEIEFAPYEKSLDLISALDNNEIDFIIHSEWFSYFLKAKGKSDYNIHLTVPTLEATIHLAVRNDWPELTVILNKVLVSSQEEIRALKEKWSKLARSADVKRNVIQLSREEQNWLAKHPVIKVGIDPLRAPLEFLGNNDTPQGISPQLLKRIEPILGVRFEYTTEKHRDKAYRDLLSENLDLLPALSPTDSRKEDILFTSSYMSIPISIFSAVDRAYLGGIDALRGKKIVVVKGHAIHDLLRNDYPELEVTTEPSLKAALKSVANGDSFALIGDLIATSYYIGQTGMNQIKVVGETEYEDDLAMAVRFEDELFVDILNKALQAIPESQQNEIFSNWSSVEYRHSVDYRLLLQGLAAASFIVILILYWNRRLHREIQQRRIAEEASQKARQKAEVASLEAQKAARVKSRFLANMSHEIRTPINTVISAGNLLHLTELSTPQKRYLSMLVHSAEALKDTIDDILEFSKGEAKKTDLELQSFEIDNVLFQTKQIFALPATEKKLALSFTVSPDLPSSLKGDPEKFAQILRNLISNAIKFTDKGGINVSVSLTKFDQQPTKRAWLRTTVTDTGIGISEELQKDIFEPFVQDTRSNAHKRQGTGLGLSIVQQVVDLMGGTISLDSTLDTGTTFTVDLPFHVSEKTPRVIERAVLTTPETPPPLANVPELSGLRILLVEDHELNQILTQKILEILGVVVATASSGQAAIKAIETEPYDLILMDIEIPDMNGYETTKRIRSLKNGATLPIVALSAHVLSEERERCKAAGMDDFLGKPFAPEQLKETLLKWIR